MNVVQKLKSLVTHEQCPRMLAYSFCLGVYIAFSPFIGLHTLMAFAFAWLFRAHLPAIFAGSLLINNPWTMVPVYTSDYLFGHWLFEWVLGFNLQGLNPAWMSSVNGLLANIGLAGVSLWSFLLGGNLLGVLAGVMLYPLVKRFFAQMIPQAT